MNLLLDTLTNVYLWGAIIATIVIIFLGWLLVKIKIFKTEWKDVLISIVMNICFPALIIKSFMITTDSKNFIIHAITLSLSIAFYVIGALLYLLWSKLILSKILLKQAKNNVLSNELHSEKINKNLNFWMMCLFGSTVFFGTPVINVLYGNNGLITQAIWNIPFIIGLASFCQFQYLDIKFKKENKKKIIKSFLSPTIICSIIGAIIWITQLIPGSNLDLTQSIYYDKSNTWEIFNQPIWWFDLQFTAPWIYKTIDIIQLLTSPLIWLSIGMVVASYQLKIVFVDKIAWGYSFIKLLIIPFLMMLIISGFYYLVKPLVIENNDLILSQNTTIITILMATPPATICLAYAIKANKNANFASNSTIITTLFTPLMIPLWVFITQLFCNSINL